MNLNGKQFIGIAVAVLGVLMIAKAQLTAMFGPAVADYIVNASGLINMILGSVGAAISGTLSPEAQSKQMLSIPGGQETMVRQVLAMPGVENIDVNRKASPELAALAVDESQPKISPVPKDLQAVAETAKTAAGT